MRRAAAILALVVLLAAAPTFADRESAQFFAARAEKALAAKDFAGAEESYRRALTEDATFHPARFGLAQALLGLARPAPALEELRKFAADVKGDAAAPADWKALAAKAEKQFAEMDAAAAEIHKLVDKYTDDLIALARKWAPKDAEVSERAARRALLLRPDDPQATEALSKVDDAAKGLPIPLFNGFDLKNWELAEFPHWSVANDVIVADVRQGSREMRTQQTFDGDFDVRMEAKITEEKLDTDTMILLAGGYRGSQDFVAVGLINRKVYFVDRTGERDKRIIVKTAAADWKSTFDLTAWNTYELRFRAEKITALINGEVVGEDPNTDRRRSGFVGLVAQAAKVAFRKVEVQRR